MLGRRNEDRAKIKKKTKYKIVTNNRNNNKLLTDVLIRYEFNLDECKTNEINKTRQIKLIILKVNKKTKQNEIKNHPSYAHFENKKTELS